MAATYDPNSNDPVTHVGAKTETWRIFAGQYEGEITLRVQGEPNFMSPYHAWLVMRQLQEQLRGLVCMECGGDDPRCQCWNDE